MAKKSKKSSKGPPVQNPPGRESLWTENLFEHRPLLGFPLLQQGSCYTSPFLLPYCAWSWLNIKKGNYLHSSRNQISLTSGSSHYKSIFVSRQKAASFFSANCLSVFRLMSNMLLESRATEKIGLLYSHSGKHHQRLCAGWRWAVTVYVLRKAESTALSVIKPPVYLLQEIPLSW